MLAVPLGGGEFTTMDRVITKGKKARKDAQAQTRYPFERQSSCTGYRRYVVAYYQMLSCSMAKSCSLVSGVGWYHFVFCFRIRFVGCLFFEKVKLQNGITNKKGTNSHLISQFWCGNQVFVPVGKSRHALEQPPTETRKAEP